MTIATVGRGSEDLSEIQVLQVEWKTDFGRPQFRTVELPDYLGICRPALEHRSARTFTHGGAFERDRERWDAVAGK